MSWRDPRLFQIAFLALLLGIGALLRDFSIRPGQVALTFAAGLLTQAFFIRRLGLSHLNFLSVLITSFSLSILLRADSYWVHPVAAILANGAKFLVRVNGKHVFNPGNLGVVGALLFLPGSWVSAGQWGQDLVLAGWFVMLGAAVTTKARRGDISWAFLLFWLGLTGARVLWLGQRPEAWLHGLVNGGLLLFAFFMISDPMTIPNHPRARILYAALVALLAFAWQYGLFRTNALLWSLFLLSPIVPLLDRFWPAPRYQWLSPGGTPMNAPAPLHTPAAPAHVGARPHATAGAPANRMAPGVSALLLALLALAGQAPVAAAFCGFYVARADVKLYNQASQVVIVRNEEKTVISMLNDYQGDLKEFALVVPVPELLQEGQIHVADKAVFERLDAWSAPRLVEYFDEDPCRVVACEADRMNKSVMAAVPSSAGLRNERARALGVTVEAQYTVGEYDIVILSARQSNGLETWLLENGYRIPAGAARALQPYIRQQMKFFVARVNLEEQARTGVAHLRPLQFAFESKRFMLPIRLGMINAGGPQDLIVYLLTPRGRVETTNYRTVPVPTDQELPTFVKEEFADVYRALFDRAVQREGGRAVFTEYAWNMGWCDPCAADPLTPEELRELGVFWLDGGADPGRASRTPKLLPPGRGAGPVPVMLTRLHVRYTRETFPEDLVFQETEDRGNFQGRYIIRHPWKGSPDSCPGARDYFRGLLERQEEEADRLAGLTGWDRERVRRRLPPPVVVEPEPWWRGLWGGKAPGGG